MTTESELENKQNKPDAAVEAGVESQAAAGDKTPSAAERARAFLASQGAFESGAGGVAAEAAAPAVDAAAVTGFNGDGRRGEVSVATIGRMLGLVTSSDLVVLEKKLDLLSTRVNSIVTKIDRLHTAVAALPAGSDFERLEVQLGVLRTALKEALAKLPQGRESGQPLSKIKIQSNQPQTFGGKVFTRLDKDDEEE